MTSVLLHQDAEERQGGGRGHQTRQGPGGREGHVLRKVTSDLAFVGWLSVSTGEMCDGCRVDVLADSAESSERRG